MVVQVGDTGIWNTAHCTGDTRCVVLIYQICGSHVSIQVFYVSFEIGRISSLYNYSRKGSSFVFASQRCLPLWYYCVVQNTEFTMTNYDGFDQVNILSVFVSCINASNNNSFSCEYMCIMQNQTATNRCIHVILTFIQHGY